MNFDFDCLISRHGTDSVKYDGRREVFGTDDVLPLWVADMDFAAPPCVTEALAARAAHPIYGYTRYPDGVYESLIAWLRTQHGWTVERDWIVFTPGVVCALHAVVMAYTESGDGVIVQPPVYHPFFSAVTATGRSLRLNPLILDGDRYRFDLDGLERLAVQGARLLLLCSPHNPVGRVWSRSELVDVLAIAQRHGLVVVSDEIWSDLVYPGRSHTPAALVSDGTHPLITAVAPSKTFNIPGLGLSAIIVSDPKLRAALRKTLGFLHVEARNPFSLIAFEAAYRDGAGWLAVLLGYLSANRDFVVEELARHIPAIKVIPPEGTYLLWLDCRGLGLSDADLQRFFIHEAHVGLNPGTQFGAAGSGFMRLNIGAPRSLLGEATARMARAARVRWG